MAMTYKKQQIVFCLRDLYSAVLHKDQRAVEDNENLAMLCGASKRLVRRVKRFATARREGD